MKKIGIFLAVCANVFNINAQNKINGHEYVDLGLSVKWATCNVGANKPEEYGNYYAWGETTTKSSYTEDNCLTCGANISDISGNAIYDAARANWGDSWRMPTIAEMEELKNKCTWGWTSQSGVNGYKVTGPNGNSIFLPAAGIQLDSDSPHGVGKGGCYWSSTSDDDSRAIYAQRIMFGSRKLNVDKFLRKYGEPVRPVTE